ncbi:Clavaminate synthase-like protein, partial [Wallemia mellicola]
SRNLVANKPCLIISELVKQWPAYTNWRSLDSLKAIYGDQIVSVALCDVRDFSDQKREDMRVDDAITRMLDGERLYIKDWHLALRTQSDFYNTPAIFFDDWMNDYYLRHTDDDFRFVYAGSASTFTGLHRDSDNIIDRSYSWSANIVGKKRWVLFPPHTERYLRKEPDNPASEIVYDVRHVDRKTFKDFDKAEKDSIVIIQEAGQIIFIPSGWYHQVENIDNCISINHNWSNSNCLLDMYSSMKEEYLAVESSVMDIKDILPNKGEWYEVVNDLFAKSSGWNWITFFAMLTTALENTDQDHRPDKKITERKIKLVAAYFREEYKDMIDSDDRLCNKINQLS